MSKIKSEFLSENSEILDELKLKDKFFVKVKTGCSSQSITLDEDSNMLVVCVKSRPENGLANKEVLSILKKMLGKKCEIASGSTSSKKLIRFI